MTLSMKIPQELRSLKVNFGMYNLAVLPLLVASPTSDALLHTCQPSSMKKIPKFQRSVALTCMADWQFRTSGVSRTHIGRRFFSRHSTFHVSVQKPNCLRGSSFSGINERLVANTWCKRTTRQKQHRMPCRLCINQMGSGVKVSCVFSPQGIEKLEEIQVALPEQ